MLLLYFLGYFMIFDRSGAVSNRNDFDCQHKSTDGRDYRGTSNRTRRGIPCLSWAQTPFTHVGDHNFCRNLADSYNPQVWCIAKDTALFADFCSVPFCPPLKVLDFSLDNDWKPDANNSFSHASLQKENFPSSFTICLAFMVDRWETASNSPLFLLRDGNNKTWLYVELYASESNTEFTIRSYHVGFSVKSPSLLFPMQWKRVCFSFDSNELLATLVVDGKQLVARKLVIDDTPQNLNLILGWSGGTNESPGKVTGVNIFRTHMTNMSAMTEVGSDKCGSSGNFLNWEEVSSKWSLHSMARMELVDSARGPCRRESRMHIFPMMEVHDQSYCMHHCQKLGGRSPAIRTLEEWETFSGEVQHIRVHPLGLPIDLWLSATEGDMNGILSHLDHWPEGTEAVEGVWRDFYTGEKLENYRKPWFGGNKDWEKEDAFNCIYYKPRNHPLGSWEERECRSNGYNMGCPCTFNTPPIVRLRGFCPDTDIEHDRYTPVQLQDDPTDVIMVGRKSALIKYNTLLSKWVLEDKNSNVTATSAASHHSYALGKHNWTISGDTAKCSDSQARYTIEMKLTGCKEDEFTCDDGQCINLEKRCDQLPNCRDRSDEIGCKFLILDFGYNKRVPPIILSNVAQNSMTPVNVKVDLTLLKVVSIKEEDHSIELQFEISLQWNENRARYHNLNANLFLNALSLVDIKALWLPRIIYRNTDQQETTRLGETWEWTTNVWVEREGRLSRGDESMLDETEIWKGAESSLVMVQSYTHEFQCVYQLDSYPFDTQVKQSLHTKWF